MDVIFGKNQVLVSEQIRIIPVTENPVYSGYLLQRYDDYEDFS